jgi:hypothetical protein
MHVNWHQEDEGRASRIALAFEMNEKGLSKRMPDHYLVNYVSHRCKGIIHRFVQVFILGLFGLIMCRSGLPVVKKTDSVEEEGQRKEQRTSQEPVGPTFPRPSGH